MKRIISLAIGILITGITSSCAFNATGPIAGKMDTTFLNYEMETPPIDLAAKGQCPGTKPLQVVNAETRIGEYCINDTMGCRMHIIPKDFGKYVVEYMEEKFVESGLKVDPAATDTILVSIEEVKAIEHGFTFGSRSAIKVEIPAIDHAKTYKGKSGSGLAYHAVAYAVHMSVVELLNDPVFQKYVTCNENLVTRTEASSKNLKIEPQTAKTVASSTAIKRISTTPGPETIDKGKSIKIALFPMNIFSSEFNIGKWEKTQNDMIRLISEYASGDPEVDFVLSYKQLSYHNENPDILSDISNITYKSFWSRKSVFSQLEPDLQKVQMLASKTDANWAVFIRANIAHSKPTIVDTYLYNFETKELTTKTQETERYSIAEVAIKMIKEVLRRDDNMIHPNPTPHN